MQMRASPLCTPPERKGEKGEAERCARSLRSRRRASPLRFIDGVGYEQSRRITILPSPVLACV